MRFFGGLSLEETPKPSTSPANLNLLARKESVQALIPTTERGGTLKTKYKFLVLIGIATIVMTVWLGSASAFQSSAQDAPGIVKKNGFDLDIRSAGRQLAEETAALGNVVPADEISPVPGEDVVPQIHLRGGNVQVNDGSLDNIQIFSGFRPFVKFTQSETSVAAFGPNIVAAYNTSANQPLVQINPTTLAFTHRFGSGFSVSNDGGETWSTGFFPPVPGSIVTAGDPSLDVDRNGNFYFAGLGLDAANRLTIQTNKSTDGGRTWSDAVVVQQDNGGDKEWLAVGPDPVVKNRDNVYVTWESFQPPTSGQLRLGRSIDGGATWATKTIFAPAPNPNPMLPQDVVNYSNTYVDQITGTLYIPFLHFSNSNQDFIRILISDDAGETFRFATFNIAGALDPTLLPVTSAGEVIDCRSGGLRLTIHSGAPQPGRFGLRSFRNASRLVTQPAFAARNGRLYLAWDNSTSTIWGDPNSHSNILFMGSSDGGATWSSAIQVNPTVANDTQHVLPSLSIDTGGNDVHVGYYTQHADGTIDVDLANSHDRGDSFPADRTVRLTGSPMNLPPTNITLTATTSTNSDRTKAVCYALGEYMSVRSENGHTHVLWSDTHNTVTEPVNALDPISGQTHSQEDVVYQKVTAH